MNPYDTRFDAETAIMKRGDIFEADLKKTWWVARGPHGGYLASIMLRALLETLDDPARPPRSLTLHYLRPPQEGPIQISTRVDRSGRTLTSMSGEIYQGERLCARCLAAFSGSWNGETFLDARMPDVPPPDESMRVPTDGVPAFLSNFDMRWAVGDPPFSGSSSATVGGWLRMVEPRPLDHVLLATFMDAWPPAVFPRVASPVVAPTIDLTIHFRAELPLAGAVGDDFYLGVFTSVAGIDGFFEEDGQMWSSDGSLIAQSRQLALMLPAKR